MLNIEYNNENPYKATAKNILKLNSIDLSHLHSTNIRIASQQPVTLESSKLDTLYHTTIPVYLLIGASVLIISIVLIRRKCMPSKNINQREDETTRTQEVQDSPRDSMSLSALFSTKSLQIAADPAEGVVKK